MFEKNYRSMNEQLVPDKALLDTTVALTKGATGAYKPRRNTVRNRLVTAAALLVCLLAAMPAVAANVPAIYELMYLVSPATAQFFMPVQEACEDNGIRMEVVAAYVDGDTARIYVTLQDLISNRVDETTDLFDSYSIHRPFASSAYCERVGYDETTGTATFLITVSQWGNRRISGSRMTFSVRNFISNKQVHEGVALDVDLSSVHGEHATKTVTTTGGGGPNYAEHRPSDSRATVLVPSPSIMSPVDGIDVTGIGYMDGKLHIQTAVKDNLKNDNHGYFFLKDKAGNERLYDYSVSFIGYTRDGSRVDYKQHVFVMPPAELADYTLHGTFFTSGLYTEGRWRVTFSLPSQRGR